MRSLQQTDKLHLVDICSAQCRMKEEVDVALKWATNRLQVTVVTQRSIKNILYLVLERKSASKSIVYTDSDPIPMFSNSCTQDRISPLQ